MVSGYTSPQSLLGTTIAFTIVANICVCLRLFTRTCILKKPGLDDAFIAVGFIFSILLAVATCIEAYHGVGKRTSEVTPEGAIITLKGLYAAIITYNVTMGCTKFSIIIQYIRIFPEQYRSFRIACYILMAIVGVYQAWTIFSSIFLCWPISKFWDKSRPGRCLSEKSVWFANAALNIVTDISIGVLPLPLIKPLNIARRTKIILGVMFALGGFTCIVSILRLESLYATTVTKQPFYDDGLAALWSVVEVNTGIVCSCLPALKAFVTSARTKMSSAGQYSGGSSSFGSTIRQGVCCFSKSEQDERDHRPRRSQGTGSQLPAEHRDRPISDIDLEDLRALPLNNSIARGDSRERESKWSASVSRGSNTDYAEQNSTRTLVHKDGSISTQFRD